MNFIYLLIVKPIETLLGFLFSIYVNLTNNFGFSIILLSLSVTVIMFPLFYIAEVWKRKEQAVEKRMKRRLDYIKKYYTGQKKYCLIKATHRMEGYTAASSFRTSFGLLIQIPFFFAAYHLLSHYEPFRGTGWLFIKDFAVPDGLLWGVNLLPVAMTLINILSSSIYMKGSRFRDIVELYVMAGVFLLLLYSSPAALVLYWTMNNVFSVGKSLIFLRLFPHEKYVPDENEKVFKDYVELWHDNIRMCMDSGFFSLVAVSTVLGLQCRMLVFHKKQFLPVFFLSAIIASAIFLFFVFRCKKEKNGRSVILRKIPLLLIFIFVSAMGFLFKILEFDSSFLKKTVFIATLLSDFVVYSSLRYILGDSYKVCIPEKQSEKLFNVCLIFILWLSTVIWPVDVFLSSPQETGISVWFLLGSNIPVFLGLLVLFIFLWKFLERKKCQDFAELFIFFVVMVIFYHYILPGDYGELDRTLLSLEDKLENSSYLIFILDLTVVSVSAVFSRLLSRKYLSQCITILTVVLFIITGYTGIKTIKYLNSDESIIVKNQENVELPDNNNQINGYSENGKNVVLFLGDMFSGGYMETILSEHPEYKEVLSGFTWYRNTVAASWKTVCSMPSIFAGEEYLPLAMTKMGKDGNSLIQESARIMIDNFSDHGYSVSVVNPGSASLEEHTLAGTASTDSDIWGKVWEQKYCSENKSPKWINQGHLFIMLSLFQNSPYFMKPVIYNDSCWFIFSNTALYWSVREHALGNYGFMKLLPEISNTEEKNNTFKYFHNSLPHSPYCVDENGELVEAGQYPDKNKNSFYTGRSAYYSALEFTRLFVQWCEWLKSNGIYDNTYIIFMSDHGNSYVNDNPLVPAKDFNRLNSLLMVKEFNSHGELKKSDKFMCSSDAALFLKNAADGTPVDIPDDRILQTVKFDSSVKFLKEGQLDCKVFEVHDNIFKAENWKVIK